VVDVRGRFQHRLAAQDLERPVQHRSVHRPGLPSGVRELALHPNYIAYRVLNASRTVEILRIKLTSQQMP
jgi:hypothetical protein